VQYPSPSSQESLKTHLKMPVLLPLALFERFERLLIPH
jgi:hypothetical protein